MDTISSNGLLDNISVVQMQDRYSLSTRQAVYNRLDKLGIKPVKGKITAAELAQMDQLHLEQSDPNKGSTLSLSSPSTRQIKKSTGQLDNPAQQPEMMMAMFEMLARMQPTAPVPDPREELRSRLALLRQCAEDNVLLPTSELAPLLGLPSLNTKQTCSRYGYRITRAGKHGAQIAWKIESLK